MAPPPKTQWNFGELFPPEETRRVLSVSELTSTVRRLLEKEIGDIWISGEVTNLRAQSSGHVYFTLKDSGAQLSCVLFRGGSVANREFLQDGARLLLNGSLTVYEARGQYQLLVRAIEPQGVGALQLAFEKLKRKLQAEGLFASERKRPLPRYPQRLGIVTSPTGAAIRDVLHVVKRRAPGLEIILAPCRVQGEGAGDEIARAVRLLNEWSAARPPGDKIDVILVTRGGGSLEDLWAFNEESVARAIFESAVPVVSAVGHEIDFTIGDFVADFRAATPSAGAEILTEGVFASRQFVTETARRLRQLVLACIEMRREDAWNLGHRLAQVHPRRWLQERLQYLDDLLSSLQRTLRHSCRFQRASLEALRGRLFRCRPAAIVAERRQHLRELERRLLERGRSGLKERLSTVATLQGRLKLLSPDNVLARGYSITMDEATGRVLRGPSEARRGQHLRTKLKNGDLRSVVQDAME
ncbi:MAG: exodeoxyribonuclease large subunit [Verrucomicrobiota bacterium]|jgi:exodeoxyribonuclease VII large subunit